MAAKTISAMDAASVLNGDELVEVSQVDTTIVRTGITISAQASDNSFNDSDNGFGTAGFEVGMRVRVRGFTGNVANNIDTGVITALTPGKMTIGGTDGDVIVDDAAGESVTIAKWTSKRANIDLIKQGLNILDLLPPLTAHAGDGLKVNDDEDDIEWGAVASGGGGGGGAAGSFIKLYEIELEADATTIEIPNIRQQFDDLVLVFTGRSTSASGQEDVNMWFNGDDSSGLFSFQNVAGRSNAVENFAAVDLDAGFVGRVPGATAEADSFFTTEIIIPDYANANTKKNFASRGGSNPNNTAGAMFGINVWGDYRALGPITSVTLGCGTGDFQAGSKVIVYARGGALFNGNMGLAPMLYDISVGVPRLNDCILLGDTSKFAFTENRGIALNVKYYAGSAATEFAGFAVPMDFSQPFHVAFLVLPNWSGRQYFGPTMGIHDSVGGRMTTLGFITGPGYSFCHWDDYNSRNSIVSEPATGPGVNGPHWMHIKSDGTDVQYGFSRDGANPLFRFTEAISAWVASADSVAFGYFGQFDGANDQLGSSMTYLCVDLEADDRVMGVPKIALGSGGGSAYPTTLTPPLAADFPDPQAISGTTIALTDKDYGLLIEQTSAPGFQSRGFTQPAPATPYDIYMLIDYALVDYSDNCRVGIMTYDSGSSKSCNFGAFMRTTGVGFGQSRFNNPGSFAGDTVSNNYTALGPRTWLRLENDGTNLNFYIAPESADEWLQVISTTIAAFMGAVTDIGIHFQANQVDKMRVLSWGFTDPLA